MNSLKNLFFDNSNRHLSGRFKVTDIIKCTVKLFLKTLKGLGTVQIISGQSLALSYYFCLSLILISPFAMGFGEHLETAYAASLFKEYLKIAAQEPIILQLLNDAVAKAHSKSHMDFISSLTYCDDPKGQGAAVIQTFKKRILFFTRLLDEGGANKNLESLKKLYLEQYKSELPKGVDLVTSKWQFEDDYFILDSNIKQGRQICLRKGVLAVDSVPLLAHELVHFLNIQNTEIIDILAFKNVTDYSVKSVLRVGDEVDAYILQFSLIIKLRGKSALRPNTSVGRLFSDKGEFLGNRMALAQYIIHNMGYDVKRLRNEYVSLAKAQLPIEERRLALLENLLEIRVKQEVDFAVQLQQRSKFMEYFSTEYQKETIDITNMKETAIASKLRLVRFVEKLKDRCHEIEKRLNRLN